ncbi:DUF4399 domain-containing protein [Massilia sp. CMS3.1]|uniref:DUF4399 domain-containing protein n=1 Tax=Massilia sp. CMS3.1 TaxID=3373083 RepID=UPI003EE4A120
MRHTAVLSVLLVAVLHAGAATGVAAAGPAAAPAPSPGSPQVYFIWPYDGTVITGGKFWVRMGLRNMGVAPKGTAMANTGHHHILINTPLPSMTEPIPNDRNHLHFGAGETEARIELPPGSHTLQLLLGDLNHVPHKPPVVSKKITVTVR